MAPKPKPTKVFLPAMIARDSLARSPDGITAVNVQDGAGGKRRRFRGEEDDRPLEFVNASVTLHRGVGQVALKDFGNLGASGGLLRVDETGREGIYSNVILRPLRGHAARQVGHSG